MIRSVLTALAACAALSACVTPATDTAPEVTFSTMRWDHRTEADRWTEATHEALITHGAPLLSVVPGDIDTWCPGYLDHGVEGRIAFWSAMFSALAKHESTWNPNAVGGGGRWFGLVQIAPATARGYGCEARSGAALQDGELNLSCAVRIAAVTVPRDGVVSAGMRGLAADWGPFHSSSKRADMIEWVRSQPYCAPAPAEPEGPFAALLNN